MSVLTGEECSDILTIRSVISNESLEQEEGLWSQARAEMGFWRKVR